MQHIMIRLSDQRVIAPTAAGRCLLARSVLAAGRSFGLLLFRCADSHLHQMAACAWHEALELGRQQIIGPVLPARPKTLAELKADR